MGLSGRKAKQRIGKDPRNLSWADDASRFGQAYLAKFGWDASKGLGVSGEGRTSAIKVTQKLDMLGIGVRQQGNLEGGIAWRQNRDFEDLLRRLNDRTTADTTGSTMLDSFHKARETQSEALEGGNGNRDGAEKVKDDDGKSDDEEGREDVVAKKDKKRKKKRRKPTAEEEEAEEGEGLDRKERKKRRKKSSSSDEHAPEPSSIESKPPPLPPRPSSLEAPSANESGSVPMGAGTTTGTATRPTATTAPVPIRAPPRTHRARIIAAKRMAASNSTALAEILGIPSSSSSSAFPSAIASPLPNGPALAFATTSTTTSNATATPEAEDPLQKLTTSSQSVGDYFRAKLNAKAHGERQRQARPTSAAASASTRDDGDDGRAGLGLGASRIPPPDGLDGERVRGGIGSSSLSMFATMFMPRQPTTNAWEEDTVTAGVEMAVSNDASDYDDNDKKSEKKRAKEERRRKKEERRRKRAEVGQVDRVAVEMPMDAPAARSKKKHREHEAPDGRLEGSRPSGADVREAIATKKRKKDKKSSKHRGLDE